MAPRTLLPLIGSYIAVVGSYAGLVFLSSVLHDAGLSPAQVATVLLVHAVATTVGGPLWSARADRTGQRTRLLVWSTGLSALLAWCQLLPTDPWIWGLILALFGLARGGIGPLLDATTLGLLGTNRDRYGRVRLWGSLSYLVVVQLTGVLQDHYARAAVVVSIALLSAATVLAALLPKAEPEPATEVRWLPLLRHGPLGLLTLVAVMHGVTITNYDSLFPLLTEERGLPDTIAGRAMAVGVGAEIAVMAAGPWLLRRVGIRPLLMVALGSGIPRWWFTGTVHSTAALIAVQSLHGLGFGLWWVAGVAAFARLAPPGRAASAQALLLIGTFGVGRLLAMGMAGVALRHMSVAAWFQWLSAFSLLTCVVCLLGERATFRRPSSRPSP